jgi:hypothetical protein
VSLKNRNAKASIFPRTAKPHTTVNQQVYRLRFTLT